MTRKVQNSQGSVPESGPRQAQNPISSRPKMFRVMSLVSTIVGALFLVCLVTGISVGKSGLDQDIDDPVFDAFVSETGESAGIVKREPQSRFDRQGFALGGSVIFLFIILAFGWVRSQSQPRAVGNTSVWMYFFWQRRFHPFHHSTVEAVLLCKLLGLVPNSMGAKILCIFVLRGRKRVHKRSDSYQFPQGTRTRHETWVGFLLPLCEAHRFVALLEFFTSDGSQFF